MTTWDGNKLIELREGRGMSRIELTLAWWDEFEAALSVQTVHNWETNNKAPGRMNLLRVAYLFEKPIDYFFSGKPAAKKPTAKKSSKRWRIF